MINKYITYILTSFLSILSLGGNSQKELTLSQCIELGLANNYQIQIVKKQTAIAENNDTWGMAGRYPSIGINIAQNNNISDQSQNPTSFIQELLISNSVQGGVQLNWTLFNGFAVSANKEKLAQLKEQSAGNEAMVVENTIQAITLAYYNALLQKDKLTLIGEVMSLSYDRYKYFEVKKNIGTSTSFETLQYKNAFLTDSSNYLLQQLAYDNALRSLKQLMLIDENIDIKLSDKLRFEDKSYELSDLKSKMFSNNTNIKNQYINLAIMKQELRLAKANLYPSFNFALGANATNSRFKIADFPAQNGLNINYYANFSLSYNLYNGGKVKTQISNTKIQEEIANLTIEDAKVNLSTQLNTQYQLFEARKQILKLSKDIFNNARVNLALAEERFKSGLINSFDYRDLQLAFLNTGITSLEATYQLIDVHTELTRITGGLIQE